MKKLLLLGGSAQQVVAIKTATTLDGKIATKTGSSKWITQEDARKKGKELRRQYDCVLTTSSTVIADNPKFECDKKVLIDRTLKCQFDLQYFKSGKIYVITEKEPPETYPENVEFIQIKSENSKINVKTVLEKLYKKGICSVFVEAGGKFNGELIENDLVDKIYQFIAPKIIGDNFAISAYDNCDVEDINFSKNFKIKSVEKFKTDILLILTKN